MATLIKKPVDFFRTNLWFIPTLITLCSAFLAFFLIEVDRHIDQAAFLRFLGVYGEGPEGMHALLSVIASSMITIAGVIFSITMLALAQVSIQYSPRVLRRFMGDRITQIVLGNIIGVFTYCMIVLRVVHPGSTGYIIPMFIPSIAVLGALFYALINLGLLISFLHHIANLLQVSNIIRDLAQATIKEIDKMYPSSFDSEKYKEALEKGEKIVACQHWQVIPALTMGYIQNYSEQSLLAFAIKNKTIVRIEHTTGKFIIPGGDLVSICLAQPPDDNMIKEFNEYFEIGSFRTVQQDILFGVQQLVDIAIKALTSGINDITTAGSCLNYLSAILAHLTNRDFGSPYLYHDGELRLIRKVLLYENVLRTAFNQIRQNSEGNFTILKQALATIRIVAKQTHSKERKAMLQREVDMLQEEAERSIKIVAEGDKIKIIANSLKELL